MPKTSALSRKEQQRLIHRSNKLEREGEEKKAEALRARAGVFNYGSVIRSLTQVPARTVSAPAAAPTSVSTAPAVTPAVSDIKSTETAPASAAAAAPTSAALFRAAPDVKQAESTLSENTKRELGYHFAQILLDTQPADWKKHSDNAGIILADLGDLFLAARAKRLRQTSPKEGFSFTISPDFQTSNTIGKIIFSKKQQLQKFKKAYSVLQLDTITTDNDVNCSLLTINFLSYVANFTHPASDIRSLSLVTARTLDEYVSMGDNAKPGEPIYSFTVPQPSAAARHIGNMLKVLDGGFFANVVRIMPEHEIVGPKFTAEELTQLRNFTQHVADFQFRHTANLPDEAQQKIKDLLKARKFSQAVMEAIKDPLSEEDMRGLDQYLFQLVQNFDRITSELDKNNQPESQVRIAFQS